MSLFNFHYPPSSFHIFQIAPYLLPHSPSHSLSPPNPRHLSRTPKTFLKCNNVAASAVSHLHPSFGAPRARVPKSQGQVVSWSCEGDGVGAGSTEYHDLAAARRSTLRLVECSMFAAVAGLAYLLSNSLAIENYFGCFFSLPIVISSIRWGVAAGRKTMVATAMLLLVLSGPVKALTYLFMHGLLGFAMGYLWSVGVNWSLSVFLCTVVRATGVVGYVLLSSFLIRENILALITINIHAALTYVLAATGINSILSMNTIYSIFGSLVLLNCGFFVFLVHILYAIFLARLGIRASLTLPKWLQKAL